MHPGTLAVVLDQAGFAQKREMAGNLGLRQLETGGELTDAKLAMLGKQHQNVKPGGVCQSLEKNERVHCIPLLVLRLDSICGFPNIWLDKY
jgi:hypothetical protein